MKVTTPPVTVPICVLVTGGVATALAYETVPLLLVPSVAAVVAKPEVVPVSLRVTALLLESVTVTFEVIVLYVVPVVPEAKVKLTP